MTHVAVALRSACFAFDEYLFTPGTTCLSNLIAANYARFIVDIYWDPARTVWSLCPARLEGPDTPASLNPASAESTRDISTVQFSARAVETILPLSLSRRQSEVPQVTSLVSKVATSSTSSSVSSNASPTDAIRAGSYTCDANLTFTAINQVLASHFGDTSNNVNASLKYMILNLHLADNYADSELGTEQLLPPERHSIGQVLNDTLSSYLYTPMSLQIQRANINQSWYNPTAQYSPPSAYFETYKGSNTSALRTPSGWPGEGYIELVNANRLIVGFGSIDPRLDGYNTFLDTNTVFSAADLTRLDTVSLTDDNHISRGCYTTDTTESSVSAANNSFAFSANDFDSPTSALNLNIASSIASSQVHCGVSPLLNTTLLNTTADVNPLPYTDFASSAIWSWTPGQPAGPSLASDSSDDPDKHNCATLNTSIPSQNKWQVSDCSASYYGLCRVAGQPYQWRLSAQAGRYEYVSLSCPEGSSFDTPRTALENAFAMRAVAASDQYADSSSSSSDSSNNDGQTGASPAIVGEKGSLVVWLNFNNLDVPACWVVGVDARCPYTRQDDFQARAVAVPTVAAVVIFAAALLTVLVKCAGNRKTSRRRRREGNAQWEYEGIPA